ncbi:metallophosphoesterase [Vibrio harveyi]|uniref:metallophosphoesterase n=1 Tax=Vibrio harveyi TaxID=669 RepID=UPI003CED0A19
MNFKTIDLRDYLKLEAHFYGDIHGCLAWLLESFDLIQRQKDGFLFAAGDLIDRGEDSYQVCQRFRLTENYESVRGNHEDMVIDEPNGASATTSAHRMINGGEWREAFTDEMIIDLAAYFEQMPLAIEVLLPNNKKVGIVHASVPKGVHWETVKETLSNPNTSAFNKLKSFLLWERRSVHNNEDYVVDGVDALICGHNIQEFGYKILGNRIYIDTGANLMVPGSDRFRMTILEYKNGGPILGLFEDHELFLNEYNKLDYV